MKNDKRFDVVLDASDENFAADLTKALGVKEGDSINFITPQFERTDGRAVAYFPSTPEEYAALPEMAAHNLKKIGCQKWEEEAGEILWLFPKEWYAHIPNGTKIVDINGDEEEFISGETDDDIRFGALSYGFLQQTH
jgi:hypothetical protein